MVLVATIAGGVLINTAGFLQSQSEETGEESAQQVSDRIQIYSSVGILGGDDIDGNIIVEESESATSDSDGIARLEEALIGTAKEDDIDDNIVTVDGRNVISVNGNIVTEDGENVVRESDGRNIVLNDAEVDAVREGNEDSASAEVFRDPVFQGGTIRTSSDGNQEKRNVATESGVDVTNSSSFADPEFNAISQIELTVGIGPGADSLDLDDLTIQYLGPNTATNLVSNDTDTNGPVFDIEPVRSDKNDNVIVDQAERWKIVIDLLDPDNQLEALTEGEEAHLTIVTASGAQTQVQLTVPSSLTGEEAVNL
jgi:archaellin